MLRTVAIKNFLCFEDYQSLEFKDGAYFIIGANATGKSAIFELTRRCLSKSVNTSHSCVTNKNDDAFVISKFKITKELSDKLPEGCDLYSLYVNRHKNKGEIYKVVCITDKEKTHCYLDCYNRFKASLKRNKKAILKAMEGLTTKGANIHYLKRINDMVLITRGKTEEALCDCEAVLQKLYDGDTHGALSDCEAVLQKLCDLDTKGALSDCKAVLQKLFGGDNEGALSDCEAVLQKLCYLETERALSDCEAVPQKLYDGNAGKALSDCKAVLKKLYDLYTEGTLSACKAVLEKLYDVDAEETLSYCKAVLVELLNGDIKTALSDCKAVLEKLRNGDIKEALSDCKAVLEKLCDLDTKGALSECKAVLENLNDLDPEGTLSDGEAVFKKQRDGDTEGTPSDYKAEFQQLNDGYIKETLSVCIAVLKKLRDGDPAGARSACKAVLEKLNDLDTKGTLSDCKAVLKKLYDLDTKGVLSDCKDVLRKLRDGDTEDVLSHCKDVLEKLRNGDIKGSRSVCEAVLKKLCDLDTKGTLSDCKALLKKLYDLDTEGTISDCNAVLQKLRDGDTEETPCCKAVLQKLYDLYTERTLSGCKAVLRKLRDGDTEGARSGCKAVLKKLGDGNTEETFSDCEAVLKKLYDGDTKEAISDCEAVLRTLNEAIAITLPIRSPGPIQWNHSENIGEGPEHYVTASNNAEILQRLIGSEDVNEEMSEDTFQTIINPLKYTFQKDSDAIITADDGKGRIPLLKIPEGIIEAKQFSLMFAHKKFQTILLEQPDRAMHPQMIKKLRDLSIRRCKDQKTLILTSHQPEMISQWTMPEVYVCRKIRDKDGNFKHFICNLGKDFKSTCQHQDQLKQMLYCTTALFVEGITDKSVIGWVFDRILNVDLTHQDGFVKKHLTTLKEIIAGTQIISMEGGKGYQYMRQAANCLKVPSVFLLNADSVFKYPKDDKLKSKIKTIDETLTKENTRLVMESLELPSTFELNAEAKRSFDLPSNSKDAKVIRDHLREKNIFLWDSINLEVMILKTMLDIGRQSPPTTSYRSILTTLDRSFEGLDENVIDFWKHQNKTSLLEMDKATTEKLANYLLKGVEMEAFLKFLLEKQCSINIIQNREFRDRQRAYKVLKYVVPRQAYGRLDYSATIAREIHKDLQNTDLHEPDIIKCDHLSFLAVMPTMRTFEKLNNDEQITDITEDVLTDLRIKKGKTMTRWIIFYPKNSAPLEIPKQDEVFYPAEIQVENLKTGSDVKRFLTFSFENEVFAYAERAFKYVQSRLAEQTEQQEMLEMIDLTIRSLLVRKLPEHNTSAFLTSDDHIVDTSMFRFPSFENVKERLGKKSLQDCDIRGFCNNAYGILVFAVQSEEHTDRIDIVNRIEESLGGKEKVTVVWVESIKTSNLAANGDRLTSRTNQSWGTLGYFREQGDSLVAITAGHCAQTGEIMQIKDNDFLEELGDCTESYDQHDVDIAIIRIRADMVNRCDRYFHNENGEVCEASVYKKDEVFNWKVHKIGAASGPTSGVVYCDDAYVCDEGGIIICGETDDDNFSEHGDSGSVVFFYDPNDVDNKSVKLLSIVSKRIGIRSQGTIPIGLTRRPTLTRRLDLGLNQVANNIPQLGQVRQDDI